MNRTTFRILSTISLFSVAIVMIFGSFGHTASAQEKLSKGELNKLIATAQTSAEHQRIADYYKAEAKRYQAQADEHNAMIVAYKANPNSKHQASLVTHCQNLATDLKDLVTKSEELAQMHQQMATEAAGK